MRHILYVSAEPKRNKTRLMEKRVESRNADALCVTELPVGTGTTHMQHCFALVPLLPELIPAWAGRLMI